MKTKICIAVVALAMFACGGETKSSETAEAVETEVEAVVETTEAAVDSIVSEIDTLATAVADSVEVDSVQVP